ncbi:MAG: aldehyde ferredoxin oxidoreductase, partial [Gammaproteobacteria bacterium]|nr:aldehyde ferredoxin oxidoreductase [Gammaproteobacteria bacterium]
IYNLERRFNNLAGFTAGDDRLPSRCMTEPANTGKAEGWVSRLDEMLPAYYQERGWDQRGAPTDETLKRLKLT